MKRTTVVSVLAVAALVCLMALPAMASLDSETMGIEVTVDKYAEITEAGLIALTVLVPGVEYEGCSRITVKCNCPVVLTMTDSSGGNAELTGDVSTDEYIAVPDDGPRFFWAPMLIKGGYYEVGQNWAALSPSQMGYWSSNQASVTLNQGLNEVTGRASVKVTGNWEDVSADVYRETMLLTVSEPT